jgi:hypothetical protein
MLCPVVGWVEKASWVVAPYGLTAKVTATLSVATAVVQPPSEYSVAVTVKEPAEMPALTAAPVRLAVVPETWTQLLAGAVNAAPFGSPLAATAT